MIVGISGSPRKQSTEYVLEQALNTLKEKGFETQLWSARGKWIEFCTHCDFCLENKVCTYQDDLEELYELLAKANGIIIATPVYNGGVSSQTKTIMDRTRSLLAADKNFFKGKIGMGITTAGDRAGGQELALWQIHTFFVINGMIPVSGGPFGANLGANFWSKDTLEGVKLDDEGFRSLKKTVKRFAEYIELYKSK
ncbi:MAG: flavodoxin family protein [Candidatus Bathyarchaeia archaeon]|jgi:multimeric flavodoxin WrbA|nr:flavodoxin family protein [Candidatus Bathyarchaeota archaeon]MDI9577364.1 flavodoxin family protein [Thermoproteota archaeon]NLD66027.1 flavodoxin family protein [Thermoproteota archaeon]